MGAYCRIHCANVSKIPSKNWITTSSPFTNKLYYILGGKAGYYENDNKIPFRKGMLYLMPALGNITTYAAHETPDELLDHCYANFEFVPPIMTKRVLCIDPDEDPRIREALNTVMSICEIRQDNKVSLLDKTELDYLKSSIIYLVEKIIQKSGALIAEDKVISRALDMMHRNLAQKMSVADIATRCNMSTNGFIKRFTKQIGETPYAYLKKLKLRTAHALREEGFTLKEIAEKCGYSDATTLAHSISNSKDLKM